MVPPRASVSAPVSRRRELAKTRQDVSRFGRGRVLAGGLTDEDAWSS
jgi:hypothetical protein